MDEIIHPRGCFIRDKLPLAFASVAANWSGRSHRSPSLEVSHLRRPFKPRHYSIAHRTMRAVSSRQDSRPIDIPPSSVVANCFGRSHSTPPNEDSHGSPGQANVSGYCRRDPSSLKTGLAEQDAEVSGDGTAATHNPHDSARKGRIHRGRVGALVQQADKPPSTRRNTPAPILESNSQHPQRARTPHVSGASLQILLASAIRGHKAVWFAVRSGRPR